MAVFNGVFHRYFGGCVQHCRRLVKPCRIFVPGGTMHVLSRVNPVDDEALAYCRYGNVSLCECISVQGRGGKRLTRCPRICFFSWRRILGIETVSTARNPILFETCLRNEISLKKKDIFHVPDSTNFFSLLLSLRQQLLSSNNVYCNFMYWVIYFNRYLWLREAVVSDLMYPDAISRQSGRMSARFHRRRFYLYTGNTHRKKKFPSDPSCCPACGVTVRPQELEQHFAQELDRLYKISSASSRARASRSSLPPGHPQDHPHGPMLHAPSAADGTPHGRWETYKRIKANRQARIRVKNRKRKADEPSCPVCSERLSGTPEELNQHVERCLKKHNNGNPANQNNLDEEEVDVEGDAETFEEYEWAGQRRVRATSMLVGGFSAVGLATSSNRSSAGGNGGSNQQEDEDVDLVVDGDDVAEFGPAQYSEADVITPRMEGTPREQKERDALREAVISPNAPNTPHTPHTPHASHTPDQIGQSLVEVKPEPGTTTSLGQNEQEEVSSSPKRDGDTPVIEALKGRIRELEAEMRSQPFKCLICMEQYKKPVTSVCCWHVHCEQCWLHTLGAKKLCPQCNMITSPSDLRRIYM
ncbi:E3 ubiquitin-protein ligase Rnf220 isoform X4 [Megachile rotundata]|uniref:E3 ubiquitin-protein ligase Rnf220 isoform X4 n=1 Tax=Megachile rotundata TaxID=143995 RepID=UPI003FD51CF1